MEVVEIGGVMSSECNGQRGHEQGKPVTVYEGIEGGGAACIWRCNGAKDGR